MEEYVIGIDVGTGSIRGALVTKTGKIINTDTQTIKTWNPKPNFFQQSSTNIWETCCSVIKNISKDTSKDSIKGIGFDATCSLAVFNVNGEPISINPDDKDNDQNIILWMDHRAEDEAEFINRTSHPILRFVGGKVSLEMMMPKILWLKNQHPNCWKKASHYFLLPDFLTWKATGNTARSLCSLVCKCNYEASPNHSSWNKEFVDAIGLHELADQDWFKIGSKVLNPGEICGLLTKESAQEMNLIPGIPVGASLIDAHAGGLGVMGCFAENTSSEFVSRIALICGTSTCHMAQTADEVYVTGVWGPYYNAMIPGLWLLEGGQSASGKLVDHIIESHPVFDRLMKSEKIGKKHITDYLNSLLDAMAEKQNLNCVDELTKNLHVWPDYHGNRSPIADPTLRGMVLGLSLASDEEDLALQYLATIQALAYGTKHIIESMCKSGHDKIETVLICGGLSRNELFVSTHANALGLKVLVPKEPESVLIGAAELGATAAGFYGSLREALLNMAGPAKHVKPSEITIKYHERKYIVFLEMLKLQEFSKCVMESN